MKRVDKFYYGNSSAQLTNFVDFLQLIDYKGFRNKETLKKLFCFCGEGDQTQGLIHAGKGCTTELHDHPKFFKTGSHYVAHAGLKFLIFLPLSLSLPQCWDYRCVPLCPENDRI
jgi:hypothetical protein